MIKTVLNIQKELVYQNRETGESYRRVVGGLAWSALPEPGYLVVLAESWVKDDGLKARPLKILAERSAPTLAELHRSCLELRRLCQVGSWLTDLRRKQEVALFLRQNRELQLQTDVCLHPAPYTREGADLGIYAQLIMELVQPGRKVLTFGAESQLNGYLMARNPEEMREPAAKFPQLAALGYAVAELVIHEPVDRRLLQEKPVTTWDRHQFADMGRR